MADDARVCGDAAALEAGGRRVSRMEARREAISRERNATRRFGKTLFQPDGCVHTEYTTKQPSTRHVGTRPPYPFPPPLFPGQEHFPRPAQ